MARIAAKTVLREILRTLRRPRRIARVFKVEEVFNHLQRESIRDYVREDWSDDHTGANLRRREYGSYQDYVAHQRDKLEHISGKKIDEYDRSYRTALRERLRQVGQIEPGMTVLCLAARRGTEVKSFLDLGCFAVGIDLNPGPDNRYVLPGDFHDVQFPDGCVQVVFTNSLDHAFNLEKLLGEIRRVLQPGGLLILEAARGQQEGLTPGFYESFWWSRTDDLLKPLARTGFTLLERLAFDYPWPGEHFCFRCAAEPVAADSPPTESLEVCG